MTGASRPAGRLLRKIVAIIILVPLAVVIVAFAVANRQDVTLSFDPFNAARPAASLTLPLFLLVIGLTILGVVLGGIATWLGHGRWRRAARRFEREAGALRSELAAFRRPSDGSAVMPEAAKKPPERLQLRPPVG